MVKQINTMPITLDLQRIINSGGAPLQTGEITEEQIAAINKNLRDQIPLQDTLADKIQTRIDVARQQTVSFREGFDLGKTGGLLSNLSDTSRNVAIVGGVVALAVVAVVLAPSINSVVPRAAALIPSRG